MTDEPPTPIPPLKPSPWSVGITEDGNVDLCIHAEQTLHFVLRDEEALSLSVILRTASDWVNGQNKRLEKP